MANVIRILGPGCPKCKKLAENAKLAADEVGKEYTVEKVPDITEIMKYGVMVTPALVIDDEVKSVGKVLSREEIKTLLT